MRTLVNSFTGLLAHARLRCSGPLCWSAGRLGCCGVWAYSTPWGALWGAGQLHRNRTRPLDPETIQWAADMSARIDALRASGYPFVTMRESQPWKAPAGPIILQMPPPRSRFRRSTSRTTITGSTTASTG